MTIEEFMLKFEKVAPTHHWMIEEGSRLRTMTGCCPMEAVAATPRDTLKAAKVLNLVEGGVATLIATADNWTFHSLYSPELRSEMLRIVRLTRSGLKAT